MARSLLPGSVCAPYRVWTCACGARLVAGPAEDPGWLAVRIWVHQRLLHGRAQPGRLATWTRITSPPAREMPHG
jgi:hypothetical protein